MPVTGPEYPPQYKQPADRSAIQRAAGASSLISDRLGHYSAVKPVSWPRPRATGEERHWFNTQEQRELEALRRSQEVEQAQTHDGNSPSSSGSIPAGLLKPCKQHPELLAFQGALQRAAEAEQSGKPSKPVESATTYSSYGAHTIYAASPTRGGSSVNTVGGDQVKSQQGRLWGTLDDTSKRLGFTVGAAHQPGSAVYEADRELEGRRLTTTHQASYCARSSAPVEILSVDSMNRTSSAFPLSPVNQFHTSMVSSTFRDPHAAAKARQEQMEEARRKDEELTTQLKQQQQEQQYQRPAPDKTTAGAMGYGRKHPFFRHYISSVPY